MKEQCRRKTKRENIRLGEVFTPELPKQKKRNLNPPNASTAKTYGERNFEMRRFTLTITLARWWGKREETQQFDSLWVARYIAKECFNDGNVEKVQIIDNETGEVMFYQTEQETYYAQE